MDIFSIFNIYILVEAIWLILPAYAANGLTPLIGLRKKNHSIDGGKMLWGKPLLGQGKTWEGLFLGVVVGMIIALVELLAFPYLPFGISPVPLVIVPMTIVLGFLLGFGAMFGDIVASFFKRRMGLKRGQAAPLLDQEDFVIGALIFASLLVAMKVEWIIMLLVITPILHLIANVIGYLLKIKKQPY